MNRVIKRFYCILYKACLWATGPSLVVIVTHSWNRCGILWKSKEQERAIYWENVDMKKKYIIVFIADYPLNIYTNLYELSGTYLNNPSEVIVNALDSTRFNNKSFIYLILDIITILKIYLNLQLRVYAFGHLHTHTLHRNYSLNGAFGSAVEPNWEVIWKIHSLSFLSQENVTKNATGLIFTYKSV